VVSLGRGVCVGLEGGFVWRTRREGVLLKGRRGSHWRMVDDWDGEVVMIELRSAGGRRRRRSNGIAILADGSSNSPLGGRRCRCSYSMSLCIAHILKAASRGCKRIFGPP